MLYRAASTLFFITAFTAIFSNQITLAESVNINFTGVVQPRASFGSSTSGKIESIISGKDAKSTNQFESITPAKINLQSSNPTTITVSSPQLVSRSHSDTVNREHTATLKVGSSKISGNNVTLPAGKNTLEVDMLLKQNHALVPGTYTYDVTVTIVNP